jgi:hypothetical protein
VAHDLCFGVLKHLSTYALFLKYRIDIPRALTMGVPRTQCSHKIKRNGVDISQLSSSHDDYAKVSVLSWLKSSENPRDCVRMSVRVSYS